MRQVLLGLGLAISTISLYAPSASVYADNSADSAAITEQPNQSADLFTLVQQSYQDIDQYHSTTHYHLDTKSGRWKRDERGEFYIAFDRTNNRLKIDVPDLQLVIKDGKLYMTSESFGFRYVETTAPKTLDYAALIEATTVNGQELLVDPCQFDIAFLLSEEPVMDLTLWTEDCAPEVPGVDGNRRMTINVISSPSILDIDPKTKLIKSVTEEKDMSMACGGSQEGDYFIKRYAYEIHSTNQPLGSELFKFDTLGREKFSSFDAMVADIFGIMDNNNSNISTIQTLVKNSQMIGKDAPDFELIDLNEKKVSLKSLKKQHDIILLGFWATWSAPCRMILSEFDKLHQWAEKSKTPVKIVAINLGEGIDTARYYVDENEFTLPVLIDDIGEEIMENYQIPGVPQFYILEDGVITHVGDRYREGMSEKIQKAILSILERRAQEAKEAAEAESALREVSENTNAKPSSTSDSQESPQNNNAKQPQTESVSKDATSAH